MWAFSFRSVAGGTVPCNNNCLVRVERWAPDSGVVTEDQSVE